MIKKNIISIFIVLIFTILFSSSLSAKEWKKIRIAVEGAYPPFSYMQDSGKIAGFDIDIARALGEVMGVEIVLIQQRWEDMIPGLLADKYDAIIASMSITDERKKKIDCTQKYYQTPVRFIAKKGCFDSFSIEDIKGKRIGVQKATIHDRYLTTLYGDRITIKRYSTLAGTFYDLGRGEIDLVLADSAILYNEFLDRNNIQYEFVGKEIISKKWFGEGVGIQVRKGNDELREMLNHAIDTIRANGKYEQIQEKYFAFDIYGK